MPTIETLTVDVKANTSKLSSGLKGAGIALGAFGAAAVVSFHAFEEAEAVTKTTEAVIKSTGAAANVTAGQVESLAGSLSDKSGIDDEVIQSGENMLLTFKNIRDEAGKGNDIFTQTTKVAVDMAAGMAAASGGTADLKAANIQLGKALNDPIKGISALSKVGVTFTAQQEKQIETLVKSGDTLGAQKIILAEVSSQFKGDAAANKTSSMVMATAFGNLQESIGGVVAIIAGPLAAILSTALGWLGKYPGVLTAVAAAITLVVVGTKLYAVWQERSILLNKLMWLTNPYVLLAAAAAVLVIVIVKNWTTIKTFVLKVWNAIKTSAPFKIIAAIVGVYIKVIIAYIKGIWTVAKVVWTIIKTVAVAVWKVISGSVKANIAIIRGAFNIVKGALILGWHAIRDVGVGIWNTIKGAAITVLNAIIGFLNTAIDGINVLIHGFNMVPGVPNIGDVPHIPSLKRGGMVVKTGLALVHEGERFSGVGNGLGGGVTVNVYGSVMTERDLADTIHKALLRSKGRSGALGLA
jgi:hypothetical protein